MISLSMSFRRPVRTVETKPTQEQPKETDQLNLPHWAEKDPTRWTLETLQTIARNTNRDQQHLLQDYREIQMLLHNRPKFHKEFLTKNTILQEMNDFIDRELRKIGIHPSTASDLATYIHRVFKSLLIEDWVTSNASLKNPQQTEILTKQRTATEQKPANTPSKPAPSAAVHAVRWRQSANGKARGIAAGLPKGDRDEGEE